MAGQKYTFSIILIIILTLFTFSCSDSNKIVGSSNKTLDKPEATSNVSSDIDFGDDIVKCFNWADGQEEADRSSSNVTIDIQYDFRDNYLSNSRKGKIYIEYYYYLSEFGIENNLVNQYYKEHYTLLKYSAFAARDLQYGTDNNQIILNDKFAEDLKEILTIYRNHPNNKDIDPVLDYLEYDLKKYKNKPKAVISADFK